MAPSKDDEVVKDKRNSGSCYRPLLILTCILVLVLVAMVIALTVLAVKLQQSKSQHNGNQPDDICQSAHCIHTASRLLSAMKTDLDPCDNFYEFACGKWVDTHKVPDDKGSIDAMESVSDRLEKDIQDLLEQPYGDIDPIRKTKMFYRTCMDQDSIDNRGTTDMLKFISDLGGWPVLEDSWDESGFNIEERIARARQYTTNYVWPIPHGILLGLNILNDYKVYGKHVIYLDQPSLLMEGRDMYFDETAPVYKAYVKYTNDVAVELGATPEQAAVQMKELVEFETEIAKISVAVSDRRDMLSNYRRMNVSHLASLYPQFDWLRYLQTTFGDAGVTINNSEPVVLWMKPYYDELFPLLNRTSKRTIANYITWRLMSEQFVTLGEKFSLMRLNFRKVSEGVKRLQPRGMQCAKSTNNFLDHSTGRMYAEKRFGPKEREHILELISYLRRIFKDIVKKADWMDAATKEHALEKVEKMKSLIGFPSFIFNNTALTEYYASVQFSSNFFDNMKTIRRYKGLKQLAELREPSYEKWPERPAIVNAFYHSGLNAIVFPAGILQSPYYDINYPSSVNFGGIGLVIGHEITHGYDASGRSFDKDGLLNNWWSEFSLQNFNIKTQCVVDHYSKFEVSNINRHINGNMTLSENIADIGGIKQSHLAYKLWLEEHDNKDIRLPGMSQYTEEQLFFINTAQLWCSRFTDEAAKRSILTSVHSLPKFRVLGELRNSYGFAEAFKCRKGSYMNPDQDKCSLW